MASIYEDLKKNNSSIIQKLINMIEMIKLEGKLENI